MWTSVWTPVVDEKLTCIAFSQHAQEFRHYSIRVPASSILVSFSLGASHSFYTWPQIFEWAGADTNRGRILFDVWVLFEEIRYVLC